MSDRNGPIRVRDARQALLPDPRATDALTTSYLHVENPVPNAQVSVTTMHGFTESDLREVARRAFERAGFHPVEPQEGIIAWGVVRDFLKEREAK